MANMMLDNAQQAVRYSFPNKCGLQRQNTQPGHVHLLCQVNIDSSRQMTHAHRNMSAMWLFHNLIIWRTGQNLSTKAG
jgi:hypothetical protein